MASRSEQLEGGVSIDYMVRVVKKESEVVQSCPTLCDPMDCSPPGSSVHGISQARILEWVAISFSRGPPILGIQPGSPALRADSLLLSCWGRQFMAHISSVQFSSVAQWCPTLHNLMDHSTPGLPVHYQLPEFTQTLLH